MRALPPDMAEGLGAVAVDLDPEHVEIGNRLQDLEIPLGLGVEVQVEQQVDVGSGTIAHCRQMDPQAAQHMLVDIELGQERHAETRPPAARRPALKEEDVGLERGEALLANFGAERLGLCVEQSVFDRPQPFATTPPVAGCRSRTPTNATPK
jgi:hypothetical protein